MAYCTECGHQNRPGARFCRSCGALMEILEEEMEALNLPAPDTPPVSLEQAPGEGLVTISGRSLPPSEPDEPSSQADTTDIFPVVSTVLGQEVMHISAAETPAGKQPSEEHAGPLDATASEEAADSTESANLSSTEAFRPGSLVANRYRIRAVLQNLSGKLTCEADDVLTCWSCAAIQPQPNLHYCESCGAELSRWPQAALVEIAAGEQPGVSGRFVQHGGKTFRLEAAPTGSLPAPTGILNFQVGKRTDAGMLRDINEDSLVVYQLTALCQNQPAPQVQFFAVADGIGGSDAGEVASRTAVRELIDALHRLVVQPLVSGELLLVESLGEHLREMVRSANRKILEKRREKSLDMGCTLTAALFYGPDGVVANVGDSRTYLFRMGKLAQVSADHSVVANLVAGGVIKPEEAFFHEQRNVILRSLGDKPELEVDLFPVRAQPGDRLLLCSDGLWEMVRDNIIEDVLREPDDPQSACSRLVQYANQSGGEDNISVILVDVHTQ